MLFLWRLGQQLLSGGWFKSVLLETSSSTELSVCCAVDTSNPEVANLMGAITKDYSQLMKAIDKKKGR